MKRMGLTGRIWVSLGVFVIGYLLSVTVAQIQGVQAENRLERTSEALFPVAQKVQEAEAGFERMTRAFGDSVMLEDTAALDKAEQAGTEAAKLLSGAAKTPKLGGERAAKLGELASQLHALATEGKVTYASMIGAGDLTADMQTKMRAMAERTEGMKGSLASARQQVGADLRDELAQAVSSSIRQRWIGVVVFVISLVVAAVVVVVMIRRAVVGMLRNAIGTLRTGANQIASAAGQVASSAQSLSMGSNEQAASLEETSASLEQMATMTRASAKHAREAAVLVTEVHGLVDDSNKALSEMVISMETIQDSSNKVARIIKTIEEIAFQTNILALNAAVEAARAGAAGMGFAVVADEVRTLAQRSAQAAQDTASLIEASIASTSQGQQRVTRVVASVSAITASVDKVKGLVDDVSSSTKEQAEGIDQVAEAVSRIEKVTQQTAATAEESAAASEELNAQAETALAEVARVEVIIGGANRQQSATLSMHMSSSGSESDDEMVDDDSALPMPAAPHRPGLRAVDRQSRNTGTFGQF
jgi:methyl-accepting chemotaxis protein/methyl-accepting chemotaxis protein-1 (serine sensor receptor)